MTKEVEMALFPSEIRNLGIFSPAGYPRVAAAVSFGEKRLKDGGISIIWPDGVMTPRRFFAGSDEQRLHGLNQLLNNPEVDAIMALKGGYGCARLLDNVDWNLMRSRNLPVIGYSDVTAFHLTALKHGCRNHFYGPMLASTFGLNIDSCEQQDAFSKTMASFADALAGAKNLVTFGRENMKALRTGKAAGPLVPVCLSVMASLIGTPYLPDMKGHILAVEDINEPAHRIDRYLNQLRQSGILGKLSGLVFGSFTDCEDAGYLDDIMRNYARYVNGPVVYGLPFGHAMPMLTLPVGVEVTLNATATAVSLERAPLSDYHSQMYLSKSNRTLGYRWLEPKEQEEGRLYPLVLFLHGAGERGEDNALQLVHVVPKFLETEVRQKYPCFVAAPQCPAGEQWVNTPWGNLSHAMMPSPSDAMTMVMELLDDLVLDYPIDPERIYLMGISMGGYGVWDLLSRCPRRFAAAVPICGGADVNQASAIATTSVWAFHGGCDTTVPTSRSRDIVAALKRLDAPVEYTEYPGCGHNSWSPAIEEPKILPWLFSHKLNPN